MVHETCKEMLAIHALSALDKADRLELEAHVDSCVVCRLEFLDWQATAAALAYVAEPVEPSIGLRERILERIREDERVVRSREQSNVLNFSRPVAPAKSRWLALAALAASIIFIALAVGLVVLWRQNRAARIEVARISGELQLQEQKFASSNKIVQILNTPGAHTAELRGTKDAPNAHALLAVDRQSGRAVLLAQGLPPTPVGKGYQLWFISSGQAPAPGRVFTTDAAGAGLSEDQLPPNSTDSSVFAVTLEPRSGVPSPTGTMYLLSPRPGGL